MKKEPKSFASNIFKVSQKIIQELVDNRQSPYLESITVFTSR
jgi:hypothetical protein